MTIPKSPSTSPYVELLGMERHIEGGWFKEEWKASYQIPHEALGSAYSGARAAASSVYFLLHPGEESAWHKVTSDELWLFHAGGPLELTIGGTGDKPEVSQTFILGLDIAAGQTPQALVPAGAWQTAKPAGDEPVLVTCIVAPAFHYDDFTLIETETEESK